MPAGALVFAWLACVGDGSRVLPQNSVAVKQREKPMKPVAGSLAEVKQATSGLAEGSTNPTRHFAALLLAFNPAAAFKFQHRPVGSHGQVLRGAPSTWQDHTSGRHPELATATDLTAVSRRDVVLTSVLAAVLTPWPAGAKSFEQFLAEKEKAKKEPAAGAGVGTRSNVPIAQEGLFGTPIYLILRVREATEQQERLVKTGMYKDLQRTNIKMAVNMMVQNYDLEGSIAKAAEKIAPEQRATALASGRVAVESLETLNTYFDSGASTLNLDNLSPEKQKFILKALSSTRDQIDQFLQFLPSAAVEETRAFLAEENRENKAFMDQYGEKIINMPSIGK